MAGWIKIHRDIQQHWIFQDAEKFKWWIDLILLANFEDGKVLVGERLIELKKGQLIVSLSFLSKRWGKAKGTILKFLELLESDQMIDRYTDRKVTILTICKYGGYQEGADRCLTDVCTDTRPIADRCLTETKNVEECIRNNNTTTAHTHMRTREQDFVKQYREQGDWPTACMILHLKSKSEAEHLFDRFVMEYQHKGQTHQDYPDFAGHFIQWARITIQKEKNSNGDNRTNQRRGVQIVANSVEDYQGPF